MRKTGREGRTAWSLGTGFCSGSCREDRGAMDPRRLRHRLKFNMASQRKCCRRSCMCILGNWSELAWVGRWVVCAWVGILIEPTACGVNLRTLLFHDCQLRSGQRERGIQWIGGSEEWSLSKTTQNSPQSRDNNFGTISTQPLAGVLYFYFCDATALKTTTRSAAGATIHRGSFQFLIICTVCAKN